MSLYYNLLRRNQNRERMIISALISLELDDLMGIGRIIAATDARWNMLPGEIWSHFDPNDLATIHIPAESIVHKATGRKHDHWWRNAEYYHHFKHFTGGEPFGNVMPNSNLYRVDRQAIEFGMTATELEQLLNSRGYAGWTVNPDNKETNRRVQIMPSGFFY